uniref:Uncharacterized protein n=1 Tax=Alexandrium monilatum TaxID=311494 RepID=A0A7S4Q1U6_9DINO
MGWSSWARHVHFPAPARREPSRRAMEASEELRAKLFRRLRKIEGAAAEAYEAARRSTVKEQAPVAPLSRGGTLLRQFSNSSEEGATPRRHSEGCSLAQRRRVRVPSWIHDEVNPSGHARQTTSVVQARGQWLFKRQGSSDSGHSAAAASSSTSGEELKRRLKRAQLERDDAMRAAEAAEVSEASRGGDLETEALRLRQLAATLRAELTAARNEVALRRREAAGGRERGAGCSQGTVASAESRAPAAGGSANRSSSSQRGAALAESQALAEELCGQAQERSALQVRLSSLSAELQRQAAVEQQLQEQLLARRRAEESLQERLEALCAQRATDGGASEGSSDEGGAPAAASSPARRTRPSLSAGRTPEQALPPPDARFDLDDGAAEQAAPARGSEAAGSDLEFAYDWGLGLSGRMSVARALELARWAARTAGTAGTPPPQDAEAPSPDDQFEGPLTQLQGALAVLSEAAARRTAEAVAEGQPPHEDASFDEPIASLQLALSRMTSPVAEEPEEEVAEDHDDSDLQAFELEIENLQKAIQRMSIKRERESELPVPAEAEELNAFAAPIAELQQALAKLGAAGEPPPAETEAGAETPATAPSASKEVTGTSAPVPSGPGGGRTESEEEAQPPDEQASLADLKAPAVPFGSFSSLGPAQALVRQKYAAGSLRL